MAEKNEQTKVLHSLQGIVVSDKMDKSAVVLVTRQVKHPVIGKYIKRSTKIHIHDEANACHSGDLVEICETKRWKLVAVLKKAE